MPRVCSCLGIGPEQKHFLPTKNEKCYAGSLCVPFELPQEEVASWYVRTVFPSLDGYQYLGCFADSVRDRVLTGTSFKGQAALNTEARKGCSVVLALPLVGVSTVAVQRVLLYAGSDVLGISPSRRCPHLARVHSGAGKSELVCGMFALALDQFGAAPTS